MPLTKIRTGTNEDGTPHFTYVFEGDYEPHLLFTGPAAGTVLTADGTAYEVDEDWIEVASATHAEEVNHQIGQQHMRRGTFDRNRIDGQPWQHAYDPAVAARFKNHKPLGVPAPPAPPAPSSPAQEV